MVLEYLPTLGRTKSPSFVGKYTSTMVRIWESGILSSGTSDIESGCTPNLGGLSHQHTQPRGWECAECFSPLPPVSLGTSVAEPRLRQLISDAKLLARTEPHDSKDNLLQHVPEHGQKDQEMLKGCQPERVEASQRAATPHAKGQPAILLIWKTWMWQGWPCQTGLSQERPRLNQAMLYTEYPHPPAPGIWTRGIRTTAQTRAAVLVTNVHGWIHRSINRINLGHIWPPHLDWHLSWHLSPGPGTRGPNMFFWPCFARPLCWLAPITWMLSKGFWMLNIAGGCKSTWKPTHRLPVASLFLKGSSHLVARHLSIDNLCATVLWKVPNVHIHLRLNFAFNKWDIPAHAGVHHLSLRKGYPDLDVQTKVCNYHMLHGAGIFTNICPCPKSLIPVK